MQYLSKGQNPGKNTMKPVYVKFDVGKKIEEIINVNYKCHNHVRNALLYIFFP